MNSPVRYEAITRQIEALRPRALIEVGTWNGDRAISMATAALGVSKNVFYLGFDLFEDITRGQAKKELHVKPSSSEAAARAKLERFRNKNPGFSFRIHKGDTRLTLPRILPSYAKTMDLAWLDGGHSVDTVESDWRHVYTAIRPGGVILLDDYYSGVERSFTDKFGCNRLVDRLKSEGFTVAVLSAKDHFADGRFVQVVRITL